MPSDDVRGQTVRELFDALERYGLTIQIVPKPDVRDALYAERAARREAGK